MTNTYSPVPELNLLAEFEAGADEGEPWDDGGRIAFRDGDGEATPGREEYLAWLERHFGSAPVDDPGTIVEAAQAELGERFGAWLAPRIGHA